MWNKPVTNVMKRIIKSIFSGLALYPVDGIRKLRIYRNTPIDRSIMAYRLNNRCKDNDLLPANRFSKRKTTIKSINKNGICRAIEIGQIKYPALLIKHFFLKKMIANAPRTSIGISGGKVTGRL